MRGGNWREGNEEEGIEGCDKSNDKCGFKS